MGEVGNVRLSVAAGFLSANITMRYSMKVSKENLLRVHELNDSVALIQERAALLGETEDEIYKAVEADVAGRMEDWKALEGDAADAYVERTADADAEHLKVVEAAYSSGDKGEDGTDEAVTIDDLKYAQTYAELLNTMFELRRVEEICRREREEKTVYEDKRYPSSEEVKSAEDFTMFVADKDEAFDSILDCFKALNSKYLNGSLPSVLDAEVSLGVLKPETADECVAYLKRLDEAFQGVISFDGVQREYVMPVSGMDERDWPRYEAGE